MLTRYVLALAVVPAALAAQSPPAAAPVFSPQSGADSAARRLSIDEAVALAQRNSPSAIAAKGQLRQADAAVKGAYAAFIPSMSISMGGSHNAGDRYDNQGNLVPFTGAPWQYSSGFSTNLTLFDGGQRFQDLKAAKAQIVSAEANENLQQFNIALQVKQQYYNVLAARESEAAARVQLEQADQNFRAAVARVRAGAATMSDSLRAVIQVGNAQLQVLTAQNNLRTANVALTRLTASPTVVTAADEASPTPMEAIDSALVMSLASRGPAIRQAEAAVETAHARERAARGSQYLPSVSVRFNRGGNGSDSRFGWGSQRYAYSGSTSFSLSFPLFNQFSREEAVVSARVAETNAEAQLRDARFVAQQSITQYLGTLKLAQQRVVIQEASVVSAEEDLRIQQQRYNLGSSTLLDVLTSQTAVNQARLALINARYEARMARAQIEAIIGRAL